MRVQGVGVCRKCVCARCTCAKQVKVAVKAAGAGTNTPRGAHEHEESKSMERVMSSRLLTTQWKFEDCAPKESPRAAAGAGRSPRGGALGSPAPALRASASTADFVSPRARALQHLSTSFQLA
jgi:hypothetical protein